MAAVAALPTQGRHQRHRCRQLHCCYHCQCHCSSPIAPYVIVRHAVAIVVDVVVRSAVAIVVGLSRCPVTINVVNVVVIVARHSVAINVNIVVTSIVKR